MRILALETSSPLASAALLDDSGIVAQVSVKATRQNSEMLLPAMENLLRGLELGFADADAYAVGLGPGSFTGLRAGLSFIKGLCLASPRPMAGVPSLDALAAPLVFYDGVVRVAMDARKGEVFTAAYRRGETGAMERLGGYMAKKAEELAALVEPASLFCGNALDRYPAIGKAGRVVAPRELWCPRAAWVGALARKRLEEGTGDDPDRLLPIYVRYSDQDLSLGPRNSAGNG